MIADKNTVIDGQFYKKGEEIWDLGSFEATEVDGKQRHYKGLSKDAPAKLPHYVGQGSTAYCADNGDTYMYIKETDEWYLQQ